MEGTTKYTVDLSCRQAPLDIWAKQGDAASRFLSIDYVYCGEPFDLSGAARTEIRVQKPDGCITVNAGVLSGSGAVYPLSYQSLTVAGDGSVDLILYGSSSEVISCVPARLHIIGAAVGDDAVISTNEYLAFSDSFAELTKTVSSNYNEFLVFQQMTVSRLDGLWFTQLTRAEYDALEIKQDYGVYIISEEDGGITLAVGSVELLSGSPSAGRAALVAAAAAGFAGTVTDVQTDGLIL